MLLKQHCQARYSSDCMSVDHDVHNAELLHIRLLTEGNGVELSQANYVYMSPLMNWITLM